MCYNTAAVPMGGEKELPRRQTAPHAEQPRLVAPDGGQIHWPEQTATPEIPVFLQVFGAGLAAVKEKQMKLEQSRQAMHELRKKRRQADPEGFKAEEASKKRRYRETGTTKPQPNDIGRRRDLYH